LSQGGSQLGAALKRVGTFAGLDLDMLSNELDAFGFRKALDSGLLSLDAQPALILSGCRTR
jgi:hypothetical protein